MQLWNTSGMTIGDKTILYSIYNHLKIYWGQLIWRAPTCALSLSFIPMQLNMEVMEPAAKNILPLNFFICLVFKFIEKELMGKA